MRIETNTALTNRNRQIAQYLFFFSFIILIGGFILTSQQAANLEKNDVVLGGILPAIVVIIALIVTLISVRMTNLWIRQPRPEKAIQEGLKGISNRAVLYNYHHLPVRHVLIAPQGLFAITTRYQDGRYKVEGDKWTSIRGIISKLTSIFRFAGIGNPTQEAKEHAAHVKSLLADIAPDVPVHPLIVFIDPRAYIEIIDPEVPVLRAQIKIEPSLKDYLRDFAKENESITLTPDQIRQFDQLTLNKQA